METTPTTPTQTPPPKRKRTRSPSYPALALKDAIERARIFWDSEKRHPAPIDAAAKDWNYEVKSSAVPLTVAALKKYGLFEDVGGDQRQVKLTESALRIILNEEGSLERESETKAAALRPRLHRELWTKYGEQLPSDATLRSWLLLDKKFNPGSVADFIKIYKDTISFAKLTSSDIISDIQTEADETGTSMPVTQMLTPPPRQPGQKQLRLDLDSGPFVINYPMSVDDFRLLKSTLNLWAKKIVPEGLTEGDLSDAEES